MTQLCPLCSNNAKLYYKDREDIHYYECKNCHAIFEDENDRPDSDAEKSRYEIHKNDVEDKNYQKFVSPITSSILRDFTPDAKGLDFGAGTGPVISKVLRESGYTITEYDPYFHNFPERLQQRYDYISSSEVIEHFYNPHKEFQLLKNLLKPEGKLYLMTDIYHESVDFASWYYKNDPTHVFFYHEKTFEWIQKEFGFSDVAVQGRLITFSN